MPIPAAKKKSQLHFDTEWTRDRIEENRFINQVRGKVDAWRRGGWPGATPTTRRLLEHWTSDQRERRLFFCQVEAVETAIYLSEAAHKHGDAWIANELRDFADDANPDLFRVALKMATGSGKTVVMGMLIAWQALNKLANPQDGRFSDAFLIVTPGITIKDRLRVLLPQDPESYYRVLDIVPAADRERLGQARIAITNFHAFQLRETGAASRTTKAILTRGRTSPFTETPDRMVRRVTRELGIKKNIVVLNDEAHHCYRRRAGDSAAAEKLTGPPRGRAARERGARVDQRPRGHPAKARRPHGLRRLGDAVLPARLGLRRGHAVSVGRLGLLPHRRHRVRHREDPPRPGGRRLDDGRAADLPRPA